ncbi:MAG: molecular chaperone DnaJ [Polyangiaceae bacterium]
MVAELCGICGGDGRIANSFGNTTTCPSCHGSGKKSDDGGMRDVTKTKPSHHRQPNKAPVAAKQTWPTTVAGIALANEVKACPSISSETKARLTTEIIEYETARGECTETFKKKIRRQIRPTAA